MRELTREQSAKFLQTLSARFEQNMRRHPTLRWSAVQDKLEAHPAKLWSLHIMESTGGEPDVIGQGTEPDEYIFFDCCAESPVGRRSICYDLEALNSRKEHPPEDSAIEMAAEMGVELLTEEQYLQLQLLGDFDTKTSSWLHTPAEIREQGGALFGDRRYGRIFVYQNSAPCYYRVRGFRASLKV